MNSEEIQSLIEQLKAQGLSEEDIMEIFFQTFTEGKMDRKDLETLADAMGYELTDDFKNDETPDPIEEAPAEGLEGLTKEEVEDAKEIEPGETKEEFAEKLEGDKESEDEEKPAEPEEEVEEKAEEEVEEDDEGEEDDKDWEEAKKLFKL